MNWEKFNREKRLAYRPSQRSRPASQAQLDYIRDLARAKGEPLPKPPKSMHSASSIIERLKALPDRTDPRPVELLVEDTRINLTKETAIELREHLPQLSPLTANSLVQLFSQIDSLGMAFILDAIYQDTAPEDPNELILWLLQRFLEEIAPVTCDDTAALV